MVYKLRYKKHVAVFQEPGGTSRGVLYQKPSWIICLSHPDYPKPGFGEISIIPNLSVESELEVEAFLKRWNKIGEDDFTRILLTSTPAIRFGLEMTKKSLENQAVEMFGEKQNLKIASNGLVWMGAIATMKRRAVEKYQEGFRCLKFKIGALDFAEELGLLKWAREEWGKDVTLRVDANGAFDYEEALVKLETLAQLDIHSIEQPIKAGQPEKMQKLCEESPLPIALDEELIGIKTFSEKKAIIENIKPQYLILKNSLIGGWQQAQEWVNLAEAYQIGWWSTSALELNLGLNAIAYQFKDKKINLPQGLGTGKVFTNNIPSSWHLQKNYLSINEHQPDKLSQELETLFA